MKQVTIICEAYALEPIKDLLREVGAHGWTHFTVEGAGSRGERTGDLKEFANIQVQVILKPTAAETLMTRLHEELFPLFGMIAYESEVRVIRSAKF
jgi:nitrogen regulatory protein PII